MTPFKPTLAVLPLVVAALTACAGHEASRTSQSTEALSSPGTTPVPYNPSNPEAELWHGTPVELMFADAFASCAYTHTPTGVYWLQFREDDYLQYIQTQMTTASCRYQNTSGTWIDYGTTSPQPELRWLQIRNDKYCNRDPSTQEPKAVGLKQTLAEINVPLQLENPTRPSPVVGSTLADMTRAAARRAITIPLTNLCIAQHLRSRSPGASGGEALLLSAADQRQLLALTKERAQMAMLDLALLGQTFTTQPLADPSAVSSVDMMASTTGHALSYIPMLQWWAQSGAASPELLGKLGDDLGAAIQLHITASTELTQLLSRSGAAHLPRGGSVRDPLWTSRGLGGRQSRATSAAVDTWGPGSWRQRALASLYGGDPLVEDSSSSTPWAHFLDAKGPGSTRTDYMPFVEGRWPDPREAAFVSASLSDPRVHQLYRIAQSANTLELQYLGFENEDPLPNSRYACHALDASSTASAIYTATETYLGNHFCNRYNPTTNACDNYTSPPITSDLNSFLLYQLFKITPDHATQLASWLDDIIPKQCDHSRISVKTDGSIVREWATVDSVGALSYAGNVTAIQLSSLGLTRPARFEAKPHGLRETAPLYSRNSGFWTPENIKPEADPSSQGFDLGTVQSWSGSPSYAHEEMRLLGALPSLLLARGMLLRASTNLPALPSTQRSAVAPFLQRNQQILSVLSSAIGTSGLSIVPHTSTVSAPIFETFGGGRPPITFNRSILKQHRTDASAQWVVDVYVDPEDPFWVTASSSSYKLYAVVNNTASASAAQNDGTTFPGGYDLEAILAGATGHVPFDAATVAGITPSQPGLMPSSVWRFHTEMPTTDDPVTLIARRAINDGNATRIAYKMIASNVVGLPTGGQYMSFQGPLSDLARNIIAVDPADPVLPAFDGFGLPRVWLPPADPALLGEPGEGAVTTGYLRKARVAAEEATAAVKEAYEAMLKQQQDSAALAAAVANAEKVGELERSALCGSSTCDTSTTEAGIDIAQIWGNAPGRTIFARMPIEGNPLVRVDMPRTSLSDLRAICRPDKDHPTVAQRLASLEPARRLDCLAISILSKADFRFKVLRSVANRRDEPTVPSFSEYEGGELQAVAIEQWTAIRTLEDRIRGFIASTDAALAHVDLLFREYYSADQQDAEMRKRCEHLEEEIVAEVCEWKTVWSQEPLELFPTQKQIPECRKNDGFEDLSWDDENTQSFSRSKSGTSWSVGASFIIGVNIGGSSDSKSYSTTNMSLGAKRRLCESYRVNATSAAWRLTEAVLQAYANIQERAAEFTEATSRVRLAAAAAASLRHQTELAIARKNLEVDLLRAGQVTSFGLYRQIHSYDAWRAKALLDSARLGAAVARKAIEAHYLVDLSELSKPEPLVASPSTWASEVYEYDLDMPSAVGLTVGEATPGGIYTNRILDYVGNLERFVNGFSIARPTAVASGETEIVSLPGPKGLDFSPGAGLPDGRAHAWSYYCPGGPNGAWRPAPANLDPSGACAPATVRPTRASILFALDPWGRLHGDIVDEPFELRHNARWQRLAVNLVGTGVLDCSRARDPGACYTQPFVRYRMSHRGPSWITDADQRWGILPAPTGRIEAAKALAAEQWLDPISNAWSKPYVSAVTRTEFSTRPLGGAYEIEFDLGPEVVLERVERVQVLSGSSYWVKQQ